ncbi:glycosyltransferase 61 family protein [Azospirillum argentinense]|uniref:EGF domain-specific O-linked N-acetylglucosamine transferase n=1 Tax=Azospirillum brasilense TaxID=192 RepID=A0A4D8QBV7_AZOBR|nr:glycosyltransferase 61 family protein [Azospirillum argentinense]QCO07244.1 DUF563 domain-containing protein [Azospirillum argentinense]
MNNQVEIWGENVSLREAAAATEAAFVEFGTPDKVYDHWTRSWVDPAPTVGAARLKNVAFSSIFHTLLPDNGLVVKETTYTKAFDFFKIDHSIDPESGKIGFKFPEAPVYIDDPVFVIGGHSNYSLWFMSWLPRLRCLDLLPQLGVDPTRLRFLVHHDIFEAQLNSLEQMGFGEDRLIRNTIDRPLVFRDAIVPTFFSNQYVSVQNIAFVREHFAPQQSAAEIENPTKIYISRYRHGRNRRKIVNEGPFLAQIAPHGFERIAPEALNFEEQSRYARRSQALVGPHGAGLANMLFAPKGAKILIIEHSAESRRFAEMAAFCGHTPFTFHADDAEESTDWSRDIHVDIGQFDAFLRFVSQTEAAEIDPLAFKPGELESFIESLTWANPRRAAAKAASGQSSPDKVRYAFRLLTGETAPDALAERLKDVADAPGLLRAELLNAPETAAAAPELRIARHVAALRRAYENGPPRLVVGAADTRNEGWTSSDIEVLNLLKPASFDLWFEPGTIEAILAEHVWEHLSVEEGTQAARTCFQYLRDGGYLRIAVPDGYFPNPAYIDRVKIGKAGRKALYTHETLGRLLTEAGFRVRKLEWFDDAGAFHQEYWSSACGHIQRSRQHDSRNSPQKIGYTSLIVDAEKPATPETETGLLIGGATARQNGWQMVPAEDFLEKEWVDIEREFIRGRRITRIVSEHLLDKYDQSTRRRLLARMADALAVGGNLRLAVPDAQFKRSDYQEAIARHSRVTFNHQSIREEFTGLPFEIKAIEFVDDAGIHHDEDNTPSFGKISRSRKNDVRNKNRDFNYTSLIIDAKRIYT